jgi:UDP-glucose 4-epimerase
MALTHTMLVVGRAGHIGSHMVKILLGEGYRVVTLDNLSMGYRDAVVGGEFIEATLADRGQLERLFFGHAIDAVMHFASFIQVGESVQEPAKYYANNVANTLNLLDAMVADEVKHFILSSSATVHGEPLRVPIDEDHPKHQLNPYGRSKWMVEQILADYDLAYGCTSVSLRYFNAAGANPEGRLGECHEPENHLVPLVNCKAGVWLGVALFGA